MFSANVGEPVGTLTTDCGDNLRCVVGIAIVGDDTLCDVVFNYDILDHRIKFHDDTLSEQMLLKTGVNLVSFLSSEMTDRALDQL